MTNTATIEKPAVTVGSEFANVLATLSADQLSPAGSVVPVDLSEWTMTLIRVASKADFVTKETQVFSGTDVPKLVADIEIARSGFATSVAKVNMSEPFARKFLTGGHKQFAQAATKVEFVGLVLNIMAGGKAVTSKRTGELEKAQTGVYFSAVDMVPADGIKPAAVAKPDVPK
jgi:hypothetical protein